MNSLIGSTNPHPLNLRRAAILFAACSSALTTDCFADKEQEGGDVAEAVRTTILANGGAAGPVDKNETKIDGKAAYEADEKNKRATYQNFRWPTTANSSR